MAKPFRVVIAVEEVMLGSVINKLNKTPGIISFDLGLDAEPGTGKANGAHGKRGKVASGSRVAILFQVFIANKNKATAAQIRDALVANKFAAKSAHGAVHDAKKKGLIRETGRGEYVLTAKGIKESKEPEQQPE